MGPHINERQYEFAVNFELANGLGVMPVIPTTSAEAKTGWDAKLALGTGWIYHVQYKVASYATRKTNRNPRQWALHGGPYFRFALLENSARQCHQHRRLMALRAREPGVYYCAPLFYRDEDFWARASTGSVWSDSALLDVADLAPTRYDGPHAVTYDSAGTATIWSEQGPATRRPRRVSVRRELPRRPLTSATLRDLAATMLDAAVTEGDDLPAVPRVEDGGVRESLLHARRPTRRHDPSPEQRMGDEGLRRAHEEVPLDADERAVRAGLDEMTDVETLSTIASVGALDLGIVTYVEADENPKAGI